MKSKSLISIVTVVFSVIVTPAFVTSIVCTVLLSSILFTTILPVPFIIVSLNTAVRFVDIGIFVPLSDGVKVVIVGAVPSVVKFQIVFVVIPAKGFGIVAKSLKVPLVGIKI